MNLKHMWNKLRNKSEVESKIEYNEPDENYYLLKFKEIPMELFPKIKEIFDNNLPEQFISESKSLISRNGLHNWMIPYHFSIGTKIRNLLRQNDILDDMFPDQNLDDYYIDLLEWWLGVRDENGNPT